MKVDYLRYIRSTPSISSIRHKYKLGDNQLHPFKEDVYCIMPSSSILVNKLGHVFICSCHGHLPYLIGNIKDFNTIEEIWNNSIAKKLQEHTSAGSSFKFCNTAKCTGPIRFGDFPQRYSFIFAIDDSCNLQCPSCRPEFRFINKGPEFELRKSYAMHFLDLVSNFEHASLIELGGDGEPFASGIYGDIIYNYIPRKNHRFTIRSNATRINYKKLLNSKVMDQVTSFAVSIDAGSEVVYRKVRYPGNWSTVIDSLDFLKENNRYFHLSFVLQKNNYRDVINFANLCQKYNVGATISSIEDWGSWWVNNYNTNLFLEQAVFLPNNSLYSDCINMLNKLKNHQHYKNGYITLKGSLINI